MSSYLDLEIEEIELGERVSWELAVEVSLHRFPVELIKYRLERSENGGTEQE